MPMQIQEAADGRERSHILLIMTDQQRGDTLGCMGNAIIKTPNLDRLAAEGAVFTRAYSTTPTCTPARAALLTGMAPWNHGMLLFDRVAPYYRYELPRMLREGGYYTFGIGKMHWTPQRALHGFHGTLLDESGRVESPGFISDYRKWFKERAPDLDPDATGIGWNENRFGPYALPEELHPTSWTGAVAAQKIDEYADAADRLRAEGKIPQPLYLKVSFARPHSPYDAPARWADLYRWEDMPEPYIGDWTEFYKNFPHQKNPFWGDFGMEHAKKARKYYYGNISFIDDRIGQIIKTLKKRGMYDNTLILFISDHGDMLGDHYHWRKSYAYEGSAHIPMIMKFPKNERFTRIREGLKASNAYGPGGKYFHIDELTEIRDVLPTFLDAAGLSNKIPDDIDGCSLISLLEMKAGLRKQSWRKILDLEHGRCYHWRNSWVALTDGKFKYIWFRSTGEELLFDIADDPGEIHNLMGKEEYKEIAERFRKMLLDHLRPRGRKWVRRNKPRISTKSPRYSPNYPKKFLKKL